MHQLQKTQYAQVLPELSKVTINHLFAKAVLKQLIVGSVYVDNISNPTSYYIVNNYGMALLFGKTTNKTFNNKLADYLLNKQQKRITDEWLQVYPNAWVEVIEPLISPFLVSDDQEKQYQNKEGNHLVIKNTRVNFSFDAALYRQQGNLINEVDVIETTANIFNQLSGSVVPQHFWNNAEDFLAHGKGYTVTVEGVNASTAYSAFVDEGALELGIETNSYYKGKGYARLVCNALIEYCLTNDLEPIWACRLENTPSYCLAQKLGFRPTKYLAYYRLARM